MLLLLTKITLQYLDIKLVNHECDVCLQIAHRGLRRICDHVVFCYSIHCSTTYSHYLGYVSNTCILYALQQFMSNLCLLVYQQSIWDFFWVVSYLRRVLGTQLFMLTAQNCFDLGRKCFKVGRPKFRKLQQNRLLMPIKHKLSVKT